MRLIHRFRQYRSKWRRRKRLLFMSPIEIQFVRIMGGHVLRVEWIHGFNGCQLVILYSLGKVLKSWDMVRELKIGKFYADFGSSSWCKTIQIDGARWHMMVLADAERDAYLMERGYNVLRIKTSELKNPLKVRAKVETYLLK